MPIAASIERGPKICLLLLLTLFRARTPRGCATRVSNDLYQRRRRDNDDNNLEMRAGLMPSMGGRRSEVAAETAGSNLHAHRAFLGSAARHDESIRP